ncbi:MAG TPA: enoyl-CoA hydratase/isomerase family protein [Terriglobales bacterium]|nr:enoyl-CoA hydratase/isomerase family protein [Terriglobales bacterium]
MTGTDKVRLEFEHEGQVARVVLSAPRANIVDQPMIAALESAFDELASRADLKAIVLAGDGPNFSFGASVQEHLPEHIADALSRLHALLRQIARAPAPTIAAVRGQCLGGGFELVLACDLVLAEETAQLGCPEIQLGVFPPAASALLPVRIGGGAAAALVLGGKNISASTAAGIGLVNRIAAPGQLDAALSEWLAAEFLPRSASALRCAALAIRRPLLRALKDDLPALERLYLQDLMSDPDAVEGIRAFLEKRTPRWRGVGATA